MALQLHVDGVLVEGRGGVAQRPQQPAGGVAVASGPGAERVQPGAVRGGDMAARYACVRDVELDGRFGVFWSDRHVQHSVAGRV